MPITLEDAEVSIVLSALADRERSLMESQRQCDGPHHAEHRARLTEEWWKVERLAQKIREGGK
jgi:hypothetical protein